MSTKNIPQDDTLFLSDDPKRKDVKPSAVAIKAIAKAPHNMAIYKDDNLHPVADRVLQIAREFYAAYNGQWNNLTDKWDKADGMYWMAQKECRQPELTLSKVSASSFYRTTRRLSDGAHLATWSEEMPVKFFPDIGIFDSPEFKKKKAIIAEGLNRLALYSMKKNGMKEKSKKSFMDVYKYANHIVYCPWDYVVEKKRSYKDEDMNEMLAASDGNVVFRHKRTGAISNQPHPPETFEVEEEVVVKDCMGFEPLNIDQFLLDNRIPDLDRQSCFFHRADMTRPEMFNQARIGKFKNLNRVSGAQRYQQYNWQNQAEEQRITNAGLTTTDSYQSEMYEHWKIWIMIPKIKYKVNDKGEVTDLEWDQDAAECRYEMDVLGDIGGNVVVARLAESSYWGNGIPYIDAHSHEDDDGWYHRGNMELLEDNMLQEQVAKGQLMDNRALMMRRPMIRQVGRVKNKDMRITHNTVFDVTSPDALKFMDIPDFTANLNNSIQFLKQDSEATAQVPPFFLGEALGGRTSATEFASIRDQSSAPALNDIKTLNMQLFGAWMKKFKEYVPQFLDKAVAVEIGDEQGGQMVEYLTADDFRADMAVEEYAVGEFQNKATMQQTLINLSQILLNPAIMPFIDVAGYLERLFQAFNTVFPNPEEIIQKDDNTMALIKAYLAQMPVQAPQGAQGQPTGIPGQGMNPMLSTGQQEQAPMQAMMGATRGV